MLIWINGPFGIGKTQTAYELQWRLPGSFVCDPEQLGFAIQRMSPPATRGDFQDMPLWREGTRALLDQHLRTFPGVIIVPMTVVVPQYFAEIIGRLRADGHIVHHFALLASPATVLRRLKSRGEGSNSWGAAQTERCLVGLHQLDAGDHLNTEGRTLTQVVEEIAERAGVALQPRKGNSLTRFARRWSVQLRHFRRD